jgi:hypothetical protein
MGIFDAIRFGRLKSVQANTEARGLGKGNHLENCERCKFSVSNRKSPTGLTCTAYQSHVPANGVCGKYDR